MSHTNHTQYYELPQYAGSDIINPLVDTNGAYETIDTTMHNIATEAGQGTTDIAALQSKVGSGVFETTAQNATDAVNEIVGELDTANTGIKARLASAESDIDTLQSQMVTAQGNITDLQNNKADANDLTALAGEVTTLGQTVASKADASDLANLTATVEDIGKIHDIIVAGDGTKTFATLLNEIYTAITDYVNNPSTKDVLLCEMAIAVPAGTFYCPLAKRKSNIMSGGFSFFSMRHISGFKLLAGAAQASSNISLYDIAAGTSTNLGTEIATTSEFIQARFIEL